VERIFFLPSFRELFHCVSAWANTSAGMIVDFENQQGLIQLIQDKKCLQVRLNNALPPSPSPPPPLICFLLGIFWNWISQLITGIV
jgi:hypothetical protein